MGTMVKVIIGVLTFSTVEIENKNLEIKRYRYLKKVKIISGRGTPPGFRVAIFPSSATLSHSLFTTLSTESRW